MFGKIFHRDCEKAREQAILQKAQKVLPNAEQYPEIRRSAAREAREQGRSDAREAREQGRQEQRTQATQASFQDMETRRELQADANKRLKSIAKGLQHDGIESDATMMQRLAQQATDDYAARSRWNKPKEYDLEQVKEVFETEYQEAHKTKTFFNPYTGEIEEW